MADPALWLVIGATSGIGREVVRQAAEAGLRVRAFGRSAEEVGFEEGIEPFKGDALNAEDVARALDGVDVVVQTLGVRERPAMIWEEETLFSKATAILLPAMETAGVHRLITVTGIGAGEGLQHMSLPARVAQQALLGRVYDDKTRQEEMIKTSDLDWTLARPGLLTGGSLTGRYKALTDPASWHMGMISRADVAHFILRAGQEDGYSRETVVLI
jgi:putative NADH-flavin reductase